MSLGSSLNSFSHRLFQTIGSGKNENFFISPFSISTALCMCLTGAKNETASQLKDLLGYSHMNDQEILDLNNELITSINNLSNTVSLKTANKIYPHENFQILKSFLETIDKKFHAEVQSLNFGDASASSKEINKWVAKQTSDKITDLIDPSLINNLTRLVLVNAIYFKGNWTHKFDSNSTSKVDFHLIDGSTKKVDMMKNQKKFRHSSSPNGLSADICELAYEGEQISMTIILPHENSSIESVEKQLNDKVLNEMLSSGKQFKTVNLQLPKFKLRYNAELSNHLIKMGANLPFDESKADFSGMTSNPNGLVISNVVHQAFVELNEEGTEAAAATAVIMRLKCARVERPDPVINFVCNRPFLFLIHENKNNGILFFGKYVQPD